MTETFLHDRIGEQLRSNRVAIFFAVLLVLLLNAIDMIAPPLGISIAVLFIWVLLLLSRAGWSDVGMSRPKNWIKTIGSGIAAALFLELLDLFVLVPTMERFGVQLPDISRFELIRGNIPMLLMYLVVAWTTAGFGEEIIWRGFVMSRVARVLETAKLRGCSA